jgi:hypothetical protein
MVSSIIMTAGEFKPVNGGPNLTLSPTMFKPSNVDGLKKYDYKKIFPFLGYKNTLINICKEQ